MKILFVILVVFLFNKTTLISQVSNDGWEQKVFIVGEDINGPVSIRGNINN